MDTKVGQAPTLMVAVVLLLAGCSAARTGQRPEDVPARPILVGMTSPLGTRAAAFGATQLSQALTVRVGREVRVEVIDDPLGLGAALSAGELDAAWLTPPAWLEASRQGRVSVLAQPRRNGCSSYGSVIFVRADSGVKQLSDLEGKRLAWRDTASASGRLVPAAWLRSVGIDPHTYFSPLLELGHHAAVCLAVVNGQADAGTTLSDTCTDAPSAWADGCREAGIDPGRLRVIARCGTVPNDLIAAGPSLDAASSALLAAALLSLGGDAEGRLVLREVFRADELVAPTPRDLVSLDLLLASLGD